MSIFSILHSSTISCIVFKKYNNFRRNDFFNQSQFSRRKQTIKFLISILWWENNENWPFENPKYARNSNRCRNCIYSFFLIISLSLSIKTISQCSEHKVFSFYISCISTRKDTKMDWNTFIRVYQILWDYTVNFFRWQKDNKLKSFICIDAKYLSKVIY